MPTGIEWTDETWNPVTGCTNISPGCDNCYAEKITNRFKRHPWGEVTLHEDRLHQPDKWKTPRKIFLCSMGDLFHSDVPWKFIARVFEVMIENPQHTFQILTKRPGRMAFFAKNIGEAMGGWAEWKSEWPSNVWAGTSVESQKYAPRLDLLAQVPAPVRFVSYEPALGPVDLSPWLGTVNACQTNLDSATEMGHFQALIRAAKRHMGATTIDWVIAGGESGPGARPAHPDWFRSVRDQCQAAWVPFFFKQWGNHWPISDPDGNHAKGYSEGNLYTFPDGQQMYATTKRNAGAMLDGREWREFPEPQRVPT